VDVAVDVKHLFYLFSLPLISNPDDELTHSPTPRTGSPQTLPGNAMANCERDIVDLALGLNKGNQSIMPSRK